MYLHADPPMIDSNPADIERSLSCQECPATSADGASERWLAFLTSDQPPEVLIYCPACAGREFG